MTKEEALKTYYGYDAFRGGQEAVIDALLSGRDALAIMPTGAGKSICYQIPALLLPGITLVVSPLVSLMRDQVTQLVQMGIPAAFLNSSLTFRQYLLALDRAREGRYKIIYVAPERLETEGAALSFARAVARRGIALTREAESPAELELLSRAARSVMPQERSGGTTVNVQQQAAQRQTAEIAGPCATLPAADSVVRAVLAGDREGEA